MLIVVALIGGIAAFAEFVLEVPLEEDVLEDLYCPLPEAVVDPCCPDRLPEGDLLLPVDVDVVLVPGDRWWPPRSERGFELVEPTVR